jgi:hypothetical protein
VYRPNATDKEFAFQLCRVTKDGGHWIWPSNGLHYTFDKRNKTMTLQNPHLLADLENKYAHLQTIAVFKTAGYEVRP